MNAWKFSSFSSCIRPSKSDCVVGLPHTASPSSKNLPLRSSAVCGFAGSPLVTTQWPFVGAAVAHDGANDDRLLGRIARGERLVLLQIDPLGKRLDRRIGDGSIVEAFEPGTAVHEDAGQGERHGKARAEAVSRSSPRASRRACTRALRCAICAGSSRPPGTLREQIFERIDRRMHIAAGRMELEIALA